MCQDCWPEAQSHEGLSRRVFLERASLLIGGATLSWLDLALDERTTGRAGTSQQIDVICKEAWGGESAEGKFSRHTIKRLTVHHSGGILRRNRDAPGQVRSIQRYHKSRGFPDIAYHFIVDRHGNIYKGRPTSARPDTFTDYEPRGHLTVMCLGNFDEQAIPARQVAGVRDLLTWASMEFDVPVRKIRGHRYYASTACPGDDLNRIIASGKLRAAVRRMNDRGGVAAEKLCGRAGSRRVRAIERGDD